MREAPMLFIKENREKVTTITAPFLRKKKLLLDKYISFMSNPGNRGDELALHLLAVITITQNVVFNEVITADEAFTCVSQLYWSQATFPSNMNTKL